ncbi:hypothetical protein B0H34DRAFT_691046 [Crassisporium funariophilum]|nr:hypothetical protein B0H34DRAFT_691046 [Crassisporium funariophilum]
MPSARGTVKSSNGVRFTCTFDIDDMMFIFSGSFTTTVPHFSSNNVTVTYDGEHQLSSVRVFDGHIGARNFKLELANGPVIEGVLDIPIPGMSVMGNGVWSGN